jgi:hypothetical protein
MSRLKNKVAVISGGNSGIGFGIAQAFKNEGAKGETSEKFGKIDVIVATAVGGDVGTVATIGEADYDLFV